VMDCNIFFFNKIWEKRKGEDFFCLFMVFISLNIIFLSLFSFFLVKHVINDVACRLILSYY